MARYILFLDYLHSVHLLAYYTSKNPSEQDTLLKLSLYYDEIKIAAEDHVYNKIKKISQGNEIFSNYENVDSNLILDYHKFKIQQTDESIKYYRKIIDQLCEEKKIESHEENAEIIFQFQVHYSMRSLYDYYLSPGYRNQTVGSLGSFFT